MRLALDTDVIIRLVTGDDPGKRERAVALFERAAQGEEEVLIPVTAIADAVFVLTSPRLYGLARSVVADELVSLIALPGLQVEHFQRVLQALFIYGSMSIDFGDAYLAAFSIDVAAEAVCSFDSDFDRIAGIRRVEP